MIMRIKLEPKPFLRWAGGKAKLSPVLAQYFPPSLIEGRISAYSEPFLGGGAMFFYLVSRYPSLQRFSLSDVNPLLIHTWNTIKVKPDLLINALQILEKEYLSCSLVARKEFYNLVRNQFNSLHQKGGDFLELDSASQFIFLNKTCFNGLYRVNKKGGFNVPEGDIKNPLICDAENLKAVSGLLNEKQVSIICQDFSSKCSEDLQDSFSYFDPPYRPIKIDSFVSYDSSKFNDDTQIKLAEIFYKNKGFVMMSNSYSKDGFFQKLYQEQNLIEVQAARNINSKGSDRQKVKELVITNYRMA